MNTTRSTRGHRFFAVVLTLAIAVIAVFAVQQSIAAASASSSGGTSWPGTPATGGGGGDDGVLDKADGVIADGAQPDVFDQQHPAVTNLDPALLDALRRAATDAAHSGVSLLVNSGWRSPELQQQLLQDAVRNYGSTGEAARWVATPETSEHVAGAAVDLGPMTTLDWMAQHGDRYGLCQTYANEPWHYELRPDAVSNGCPAMYADPTEDPRMW